VKKIRAPTLIIQGTVDNLFTLDEGVANFKAIQASGVPVHMVWFCDGHGSVSPILETPTTSPTPRWPG